MTKIDDYKINADLLSEFVAKRAIATTPPPEMTNQKLLGVSDVLLDHYFRSAWKFIDEKNWFDAQDAFMFLTFLNPFVHDFWMCLGFVQQSQSKFKDALVSYIMAEATNPENPMSMANSFQCALAIDEQEYAKYALDKAILCCSNKPEHEELLQKLMKFVR